MASEPAVRNSWAPELVYNEKWHQYIILWTSAIKGKFTETERRGGEGLQQPHLLHDHEGLRLFHPDAAVFRSRISRERCHHPAGGTGRYYLIVKDDTSKPAKKNLRITSSDSLTDPTANWTMLSPRSVCGPSVRPRSRSATSSSSTLMRM